MKYRIALAAGSMAALGLLAVAQSAPTPPSPAEMAQHRVERYTTLLSLNATQQQEATTLFTEEATSESTLRASERTAHEALETAVKADDTAAIQQAATTLGQLNGEMTSTHALADAKFYASLTADQKTKFEELEGRHGRRGPGGPSGPPPPPQ